MYQVPAPFNPNAIRNIRCIDDTDSVDSFMTDDGEGSKKTRMPLLFSIINPRVWFKRDRLHVVVEDFIYPRNYIKTAEIFGVIICLLLAVARFSLISVITSILLFLASISVIHRFRYVVRSCLHPRNSYEFAHPFDKYLLPAKAVHEWLHCSSDISQLIDLGVHITNLVLFVEFLPSLKFVIFLVMCVYIGSRVSITTIIIVLLFAMCSLPKLYERNKVWLKRMKHDVYRKLNIPTHKRKSEMHGLVFYNYMD